MAKKVSHEVNYRILFTKMICAEIWQIFLYKNIGLMLIFYTYANFILEFDLEQCPLEWNQANT